MKVKHIIDNELLKRPIRIAVIGAGGTGSALLPRLMQIHHAMKETGHPGGLEVVVYDDDVVSPSNIGRQGFFPCDVGQYKATVLVNRLNMGWGTSWKGLPKRITEDTYFDVDIVIGCVDSRGARKAILSALERHRTSFYYIDSGNGENTGQVLLGEVRKTRTEAYRLPHIGDLFPEMLNDKLDASDDMPSCSVAESLRKQSLAINMMMAVEILNLLWTLIHTGTLEYSGKFINLKSGTSVPIKTDTTVWERMGYVASKTTKRLETTGEEETVST
ncbi:PRTRC system ThiF family protein [Rugamonas sp. A1-17]|nr:PRTRC system ThiF family protein [Rugamonas sp. A1-17]